MKQITRIRKVVCAIANELKKAGYSLSQAFKTAWRRVKFSMTIRAAGTTFENRQERLRFLQQFKFNVIYLKKIYHANYIRLSKYCQLNEAENEKQGFEKVFFRNGLQNTELDVMCNFTQA